MIPPPLSRSIHQIRKWDMFSKRILGLAIVVILLLTACGDGTSGSNPSTQVGNNPNVGDNQLGQKVSLQPLNPNGFYSISFSKPRNPRCTSKGDGWFEDRFQIDYKSNVPAQGAEMREYSQLWGTTKGNIYNGDILLTASYRIEQGRHYGMLNPGSYSSDSVEEVLDDGFFINVPYTIARIFELWVGGKPVNRATIKFVCRGTSASVSVTNEP